MRLTTMMLAVSTLPSAAHAQPTDLFSVPEAVAEFDAESVLEPTHFSRGSILRINTDALLAAEEGSAEFRINALGVQDKVAVLKSMKPTSHGSRNWHGTFDGGDITLVVRPGAEVRGKNEIVRQRIVAGTLHTSEGAVYQVRHVAGNDVVVREFGELEAPEELEAIVPDVDFAPVAADAPAGDGPYELTVAVFYTPKARDGAGGTSEIKALIDLAVTETNVAYTESKVNAELKLVHTALTDDDESGGFHGMLSALKDTSDGRMDEVHTKRNTYAADLVVLICEDDSSCGLAYRMQTESAGFANWAFSVVHRSCAIGYYSFGHEIGHNMGCCHDASNPCNNPIDPHAYGWHFQKDGVEYRTIMAYAPGERIQRFSNPTVQYLGVATGKANEADNTRTINGTLDTISAFR